MKRMLIALVLVCASTSHADEISYRKTIDELMSVTQAESIIAGWRRRYETQAMDVVAEALQGRSEAQLSEAQRGVVQRFRERGREALEDGISWEKMRDPTRKAYMEAFTESEARELTAFYRTPLGQKVLTRLPLVAEGVARGVRNQIDAMRPQLQRISADFSNEFERAGRTANLDSAEFPVRPMPVTRSVGAKKKGCENYNPKVGCRP